MLLTGQVIKLKLKSFDHKLLDTAIKSIISVVKRTGAMFKGPVPLPVRRSTFTVNKSTHVYKESREQFWTKRHKAVLYITVEPSSTTIDELMGHELPSGVEVEIKLEEGDA